MVNCMLCIFYHNKNKEMKILVKIIVVMKHKNPVCIFIELPDGMRNWKL